MNVAHKPVSLGTQFLNALYERNAKAAIRAATDLLERRSDASLTRTFARFLTETGDFEQATKYWLRLQEMEPLDLEAWYHLAQRDPEVKRAPEATLDRILSSDAEKLKPVLLPLLMSPAPAGPEMSRHIAICGMSFCGSTLLDRIMGGLPGVRSIGESHWLTKTYINKVAGPIDFTNRRQAGIPQCSVCGPRCAILSMDFRASLAADRTNWYSKIARRLDAKILVSADKNPPKLVENDPLLRMDAIVLFKSPAQAWASQLDKLPKGHNLDFYRAQLDLYIQQWCRSYETFLNHFRPAGQLVFLSFDEFAARPRPAMEAICTALNLPFDPAVLTRTIPGHAIGGNSRAMRAIRENDYEIRVRPPRDPQLPRDHMEAIEKSRQMQQIHSQLFERHLALRIAGAPSRPPFNLAFVQPVEGDRVPRFPLAKVKPIHYNAIFGDFGANLRAHIATLESSEHPNRAIKIAFFKRLLATVDADEFARIQRIYVTRAQAQLPSDRLKYLDPVFWFDAKLDIALRMGLHEKEPLSILDLGTGPAHFPVVAQYFGHRTLGTDLPLRPEVPNQRQHLYDALCQLYGVRKILLKITPFHALPDFEEQFDVITAFMAAFNVMNAKEPWNIEAWRYFFKDARSRVLKPRGTLYLQLTNGKITGDVWNYLASAAAWSDYQSKMLCVEQATAQAS